MCSTKPHALQEPEEFGIAAIVDPNEFKLQEAKEKEAKVFICHVLRYTPFYREIKKLLNAGTIGDIMTMELNEHVGLAHYVSSYVRGKWNSVISVRMRKVRFHNFNNFKEERVMYSFEQLMRPIWNTDIIYDEALAMIRNGGVAQAPLLFEPEEILSVTSADKTMEYEEGVDWEIRGNMFCLTPTSRIFAFEESELVFDEEKPGECFATKDGKYSLFYEGHFFHDRQICVTYRKKNGALDVQFDFCESLLPKTIAKLKKKENVRIVLYGDSIAAGGNSSGLTLTTPFLPKWGNLLQENLKRHYQTGVELINTAVGGMNSHWGMEHAKSRVGEYKPDLAIIAFGMNDFDEPKQFNENLRVIMNQVLESSPNTEFILCATTVPNEILRDFWRYQSQYGDEMKKLQNTGIAIADFGSMHKCLLKTKRFIDMTGNNVNHPNDFLIRCHAQLLSGMLMK